MGGDDLSPRSSELRVGLGGGGLGDEADSLTEVVFGLVGGGDVLDLKEGLVVSLVLLGSSEVIESSLDIKSMI